VMQPRTRDLIRASFQSVLFRGSDFSLSSLICFHNEFVTQVTRWSTAKTTDTIHETTRLTKRFRAFWCEFVDRRPPLEHACCKSSLTQVSSVSLGQYT